MVGDVLVTDVYFHTPPTYLREGLERTEGVVMTGGLNDIKNVKSSSEEG